MVLKRWIHDFRYGIESVFHQKIYMQHIHMIYMYIDSIQFAEFYFNNLFFINLYQYSESKIEHIYILKNWKRISHDMMNFNSNFSQTKFWNIFFLIGERFVFVMVPNTVNQTSTCLNKFYSMHNLNTTSFQTILLTWQNDNIWEQIHFLKLLLFTLDVNKNELLLLK